MIVLDLHIFLFLIIYIALLFFLFILKKKKKASFHPYYAIYVLYILLLFKVTICPITYVREAYREMFYDHRDFIYSLQLIPFKTFLETIQSGTWIMQILGNVALLLPLPILFSIQENKIYSPFKMILLGAATSVGIEIIQFLINVIGYYPAHVVDIDDFIFNMIGIIIGILLSTLLFRCGLLRRLHKLLVFEENL